MSKRVKSSARALVLTRSSQPENDHLRKKKHSNLQYCYSLKNNSYIVLQFQSPLLTTMYVCINHLSFKVR
jgi:hypothetical protein